MQTRGTDIEPGANLETAPSEHRAATEKSTPAAVVAVGVAVYLLVAWFVAQRLMPSWFTDAPSVGTYVVQPVMWLGLAGVAGLGWRRLPNTPPLSVALIGICSLVAVCHVGLFVVAGFVSGFGESMAAGDITRYPRTALYLACWLAGLETARPLLLHAWRPFHGGLAFAATTAVLAIGMTSYGAATGVIRSEYTVSTLAGSIVPVIMLSVLLTWLADHGGWGPSLGYAAVLSVFEWFSRVQPDIEWPVVFAIGTLAPVLAANLIGRIYLDTPEGRSRWAEPVEVPRLQTFPERRRMLLLGTVVALVALVAVAGVFGLRPAVVTGISMEPTFERGDLAILQVGVQPADLQVGDVVQFTDPRGRAVVHRIVAIEAENGGLVFTTRGDNNERSDAPFGGEVIDARVVVVIPELGWPALWFGRG